MTLQLKGQKSSNTGATLQQWNLKPGIFTTRIIRVILFMTGMELGISGCLIYYGGGPKAIVSLALWMLPIFLVSIILGLKVTSLLIAFLTNRGFFGRIRATRGHLYLVNSVFDLDRSFHYDARNWKVKIKRELWNPFLTNSSGLPHSQRAGDLNVFVGVVEIEQEGKVFSLYCDIVNDQIVEQCVAVANLPHKMLLKPRGRVLRLTPGDLAEVILVIEEAAGKHSNQAMVETKAGEQRPSWFDPRRLFCPHLKIGASVLLITLLAAIPPAAIIMNYSPAESSQEISSSGLDETGQLPAKRDKDLSPPAALEKETAADSQAQIPREVAFQLRELESEDGLMRRIAATCLGEMGIVAQPAIPKLTIALEDKYPAVRKAAEEALKKIRQAIEASR